MSTRRIVAVGVLLAGAITTAPAALADEQKVEQWRQSTWQLSVQLDAPALVPPAVQFAVFDKDPLPGFAAKTKRMQSYRRSQQGQAEDEDEKQIQRNSAMTVHWDLGFKEVSGDQLYLLTARRGKRGSSQSGHIISSNGPDGKKWVVTKVVQMKGKPVCWYLPVEVKTGAEIKVTLSEDNLFDLAAAFDAATGTVEPASTPARPAPSSETAAAAVPPTAAAAIASAQPQGDIVRPWRAVSMVQNGEALPATAVSKLLLVFSEKTCALRVGPTMLAETPYTINAQAMPATIDMTFNGQVTTGIYQRADKDLRICLNEADKGRPKAIPTKPGVGCGVDLLLRRADLQWNILHVMDADGSSPRVLVRHPEYTSAGSPEWSWDSRKLAFDAWRSIYGEGFGQAHIFTVNADGSELKDLGPGVMPSWSPDGKRLVFTSFESRGVHTMNADGSGRKLLDKEGWAGEWCPQGDKIACYTIGDDEGNICVHDLQNGTSRLLLDRPYPEEIKIGMAWSPDGQWLAFRGVNDDGKIEGAIVHADGMAKGFRVLLPKALPEMTGVVGGQPMSWSADSKQVVALLKTKKHPAARFYLIDADGQAPATLLPGQSESRTYADMCCSPDGKHIAYCGPPLE
jgi:TolB protein